MPMNIRFHAPVGPRLRRGPAWWTTLACASVLLTVQALAGLFGAVVFLDRAGGLCRRAAACDPWPGLGNFWAATIGLILISLSFGVGGALYRLVRALLARRFWARWAARFGGWALAIAGIILIPVTALSLAWAVPGLVMAVAARRMDHERPRRSEPDPGVIDGEVID